MYRRNALSSYAKQFSEFISLRRRPFSCSVGEYHESHGIVRDEENFIEFGRVRRISKGRSSLSSPLLSSLVVKIYGLPRSRTSPFLSFRFSLTALSFTSRFSSRSSLRRSLTSLAEMPRGKSFTTRRRKQKTSDFFPRLPSHCLVVYRAVTRNRSRREKSRIPRNSGK